MKISKLIETLQKVQRLYGDIAVTGGYMSDDTPLSNVSVTDVEGMEVWPRDPNGVTGKHKD